MASGDFLPAVKAQYEELPYPPRDPADERRRLIHRIGDNLVILNHHCFGGARDFRGGFRVLVAGGGTGDATVYLAEQLRGFGAEIVHLDLSAASLAVAQERARVRGLEGIRWVNASLMDLPGLGLGEFDYINCTGVLHHLESSEAGLAVLERALRPGGAILLMLYGRYGRSSVYDMQALLREYLPAGAGRAEKLRLTRALLAALPPTNSFVRDLDRWRAEISTDGLGDAGLYDLLLHSQDRPFDVPGVYRLAASAGLDVLAFVDRAADYDPRQHLRKGIDAGHLERLDPAQRQAIAELMVGDLVSHEFYLGRRALNAAASFDDERNALMLVGGLHGHHREIAAGLVPGRHVEFTGRSGTVAVAGNELNRQLFACMDAVTPLAQVYERVLAAVPGPSRAELVAAVRELFGVLHAHGHLYLLRAGSYGVMVPDYTRLPPA